MTMEERSRIMRAVKSRDTGPEMLVRRIAHGMGYRFRLQRRDLPGKPDLAFPGRRAAIFVHGCFWHSHTCKRGARTPKTNTDYWMAKVAKNATRDELHLERLKAAGWRVVVVWECETKDKDKAKLALRLRCFLGP